MAKYCKKCGSKLDAATGLCPNCNAAKNTRKKETKSKSTAKRKIYIFMNVTLLLVLFLVIACIIAETFGSFNHRMNASHISALLKGDKKKKQDAASGLEPSQFQNIPGTCITRTIKNEEDALAAIGDLSDTLGIEDVNEEFGTCKADNVFDNSYYRFEQTYKGLPVYGRSMSVSSDRDGNCLLVTGNYSAPGEIDTQIAFDEASAKKQIKDRYENAHIYNNGLVIYSLNDVAPQQAWSFYINSSDVTKNVFISTVTGKILAEHELIYTESVQCSGEDIHNNIRYFTAEKENDTYIMQDADRGISVYDANHSTLVAEHVITDSSGAVYTSDDENWIDQSGNIVYVNGQNYSFIITDASGNQIGEKGELAVRLTTKNIFTTVEPVTSQAPDWSNKKAVTLMADTASIYDFWSSFFHRQSFDDAYGEIVVVYDNFKNSDITNAESWGAYGLPITVLNFGTKNSLAGDVIGHEFMHSVERSISNMTYEGESGALMEAYSDIFGEITQDWLDDSHDRPYDTYDRTDDSQNRLDEHQLNGSCDWIHGSRNMMNPTSVSYPDTYRGAYWADTSKTKYKKDDRGGVHTNNTVISHAAYLMWTGIGGNPAFEALGTSEIAKLFYSTLFSLTSDCTFPQFSYVLQHTADVLCDQGVLTDKQRLCVSNAMYQVGIAPEPVTYAMSGDFELYTYDIEHKLYDDYTISITTLRLANISQGSGIKLSRKAAMVHQVQTSEPFKISLDPGLYEIILTDNKNETDQYSFYVSVNSNGQNTLSIDTTFDHPSDTDGFNSQIPEETGTPFESYLAAAAKTIESGSWSEQLLLEADMSMVYGSEKINTQMTLDSNSSISNYMESDLSQVEISNRTHMKIMGLDYAWSMEYKDGTAHYQYTEPFQTTEQLKIDPNFFNFNLISRESIIKEERSDNQLRFTVSGEKIAETGIAALKQISGISSLEYGDIKVAADLGDSGHIEQITMNFDASMEFQGYNVKVTYKMQYWFN